MRVPAVLASVVALLLALPAGPARSAPDETLSAAKEKIVRGIVGELVAEPDATKRKALAARAAEAAGDAPFAAIVAAVRKGPQRPDGLPRPRKGGERSETLTTVGGTTVGWTYQHAGEVHRYAVDVPQSYDPSKPVGVLVDPGHGTGKGKSDAEKAEFLAMWRRFADEAGHPEWLVVRTEIVEQVGAGGARGALPEDEVAQVFDSFFRDLLARFAVDPDRIYVSGLSQTGFWAWQLGLSRADRFAGIAPMSAVTWAVDPSAANLRGLPIAVLHGSADPTCPVAQPRRTTALLARLGAEVSYREIADAGHDYAVWSECPTALRELAAKPRDRAPRRVSKSVRNTLLPWAAWLRIDAIEKEGPGDAASPPTAGVDGEIDGQTIRLHSEGVRRITVCLSDDLVDLSKPVEVVWNGKSAFQGTVARSPAAMFELVGEKADWSAVYAARIELAR